MLVGLRRPGPISTPEVAVRTIDGQVLEWTARTETAQTDLHLARAAGPASAQRRRVARWVAPGIQVSLGLGVVGQTVGCIVGDLFDRMLKLFERFGEFYDGYQAAEYIVGMRKHACQPLERTFAVQWPSAPQDSAIANAGRRVGPLAEKLVALARQPRTRQAGVREIHATLRVLLSAESR